MPPYKLVIYFRCIIKSKFFAYFPCLIDCCEKFLCLNYFFPLFFIISLFTIANNLQIRIVKESQETGPES